MKRTASNIVFHWLPYLFIAVGLGAGLWLYQRSVNERSDETRNRVYAECVVLNKSLKATHNAVSGAVHQLTEPVTPTKDATDAQVAAIQAANARRALIRAQVDADLDSVHTPNCERLVHDTG